MFGQYKVGGFDAAFAGVVVYLAGALVVDAVGGPVSG